jgi:hypothetical protein
MARDLHDFENNDYYKKMIVYEGMIGGFFSIKSFFASLGSVFYIMIIPRIVNDCPNNFLDLDRFSYSHIFWSLVFVLYILSSGVYFLVRSFKPLYYQFQSRSWKQVVADVTEIYISNIEMYFAGRNRNYYSPKVSYVFSVNDEKYYGEKLSFEIPRFEYDLVSGTSSRYNKVNADFSNWVDTKKVSVYFNPNNPNESVIYRKVNTLSFIIYLITFIVFSSIFGIILSRILYCIVFA